MRLFLSTILLLCHFSLIAQDPTVRLEMSQGSDAISTLIYFSDPICPPPTCQAVTMGYDSWYDALYLDGMFYQPDWQFGQFLPDGNELNTNAMPMALLSGIAPITIPLFFETDSPATFTIELMQFDNMPFGWEATLLDNYTEISHKLSNGAFSFAGDASTSYYRFTLTISMGEDYGCTDPGAFNYDPEAVIDDGSCEYQTTIDILYSSNVEIAGFQLEFDLNGGTIVGYELDETAAGEAGFIVSPNYQDGLILVFTLSSTNIPPGDGILISLIIEGDPDNMPCLDYTETALGGISLNSSINDCYSITVTAPITGCMDASACNYDELATDDDGSCSVFDECGVCGGDNSSCSGCTNDTATNYDLTATIEDGTCLYNQAAYDAAIAECPECINEDQIEEGFSCIEIWEPVCGCNDVTYSNECYAYYNGVTEWTDGECESLNPYNPDYDNDDIIGVNDLLALLSVFGSPFNSNAVCGNGIVEEGEDCDDGNDIPGDGCDGCMFDGIIQE